jgi:hypothetical protein
VGGSGRDSSSQSSQPKARQFKTSLTLARFKALFALDAVWHRLCQIYRMKETERK